MKSRRFAFGMPALVLASSLLARTVSADPLPNAWQITDDSSSGESGGSYSTNLPPAQQDAALTNGWRYLVNARLVSDFGGTMTMLFVFGVGTNRFSIFWDLNASGDLTATPFGQSVITLTTNGIGSTLYHNHEIVYNPTNQQASYFFDGIQKTNWGGNAVVATNGSVVWGSGSTVGEGQMNFHTVTFLIGTNVVAAYDAGTQNNPPIAPDPKTRGWTTNLAPNAAVTPISPDTDLLPVALTAPADQVTTNSARLNGQAGPSGSPTMAWFEWGTGTNYGNMTAMQDMGQGLNVSNVSAVLSNLLGGQQYHYRLVASNTFGVAGGVDGFFTIPSFFLTTIPDLPGVLYSSVAWGDYDNDGRLDFLLTGYTGGAIISQLWRNTGSGFTNVPIAGVPGVINSSVVWGDYDNDGRLDFLLTGYTGGTTISQLWRNTGSGFTNVPIAGLRGVLYSSVAWGDYDNDGRLDFLLTGTTNFSSSGAVSRLWRNTGSGFTNVPIAGVRGVFASSVAWGDYDNDGRLDFLLTGSTNGSLGVSQLWRNTGSGFTNVPIAGLPGVLYSSVAWGDYDNDGRLDFLVAGTTNFPGSGAVSQLWRNTGSGFTNVPISGVPGAFASSVAWGDYDNDGRLDFLLTGLTNGSAPISQLWRNTGSGFTNVPIAGMPGVLYSSVAWGDYDNDGRLDFLLTGSTNYPGTVAVSQLWRNNMPLSNAPPTAPAGLTATTVGGTLTLNWNAPTDDRTPAAGLNYNVRIGTTPGGSNILSAHALANGMRLVPQIGNAGSDTTAFYQLTTGWNYHWSVQAVDTSFAGSPFAVEQHILMPPVLVNPKPFSNGVFQFEFTSDPTTTFEVRGTTNLALPVSSWDYLGLPTPLGGGLFQFNDGLALILPQRFYLLRKQ